jgi:hypothetical protein
MQLDSLRAAMMFVGIYLQPRQPIRRRHEVE